MIGTTLKIAAALVLSAATLFSVPQQALAHDKLGANLNFIGDFRRNHEFADLVKQSRLFLKPGQFDDQNPANLAAIGTDGWPTEDFRILTMAAQENTQGLAGVYKIVATGPAGVSVTATGGSGTVSNQTYDAATRTIRADLSFPAGGSLMTVNFANTQGQVKDVRIIRPGLNAENPPFLNPTWKAHVQRFPVIRFLDWTRTNGNRDVTWADRTTPQKRRTEAYIAQWESVIEAANWLNRDPWINVPVQANDEYVTNLAILLRDRLNANLNVYVEYGNELWNFGIRDVDMDVLNGGTAFNGASVNLNLAAASPANSPLRFDGETNEFVLGFRRVGLRLKEISDIFRTVWGDAAINTRVRPVLAGQMANRFIVTEGLRVVDEGLNVRPSSVFYAISGAPYIFPAAVPDGQADEVPGLSATQILDGLAAGVANAPDDSAYGYLTHAALGAWYGVKVVAYEAGFDNFGSQNVAAKRTANLDARIRDICKDLVNQWHGFGFEHLMWFNAGADSYDTQFGMWPLVEDMTNQATPKNQCMDDILAAALPAITVGTPVLGAPIAGGSFRGSANPTGTVGAAITPDFGFPGFVEYLLRADVEGTYSLVFNGTGNAGEVFRVLLNNATVSSSVQLPSTQGNSAALSVTLRKGLNALRLQRVGGGSWVVNSFTFTLTGDSTPDAFSFTNQTGVTTGAVVTSNAVTLGGLTTAAAVTVAGGSYSVGCTGTFTSAAGTIGNGQTVCVRHTAAATANTSTTTVLTVGGVSSSFVSTTAAATPSTFALTVGKAGTGTVTSSPAGIDCGATCVGNFTGGTLVTLTATPGAGFAFAGWTGACTGIGVCQVTMLGAREVTATFAALSTLTISKRGSGAGTVVSSPGAISCGTACAGTFDAGASVTLTATASSGSTFTGWSGACAGITANTCTVTMDASKTAIATFDVQQFALTVAKAGAGSGTVTSSPEGINCGTGAGCAVNFPFGASVTLTASADAGSVFAGWSGGGCAGTGACVVPVTAATTVTATFNTVAVSSFALTVTKTGAGKVTSSPGSIDCGSACTASFNSGTPVQLMATADAGATFQGWGGACSGTGTCSVTMDAAKTVTASFSVPRFRITVAKNGTGTGVVTSSGSINCDATGVCTWSYDAGTTLTLTPAADARSTFAGWSGACSGTGPCTLTVTANATATATFNLTPAALTASPAALAFGGQSMNTTAPAQTVTISNTGGTTLTLNAITPPAGYAVSSSTCVLPGSLDGGKSCTASVTFTPGSEGSVGGSLTISSSAGSQSVSLTGTGEKSLVTHYYRSILRRAPDDGGKAFWTGEAARVQAIGVNVNEVWFALALTFYTSPEYLAFNRDNTGFVTDLFNTFFNRAPDAEGLAFWKGQVDQGLPREVALAAFMFSTEFANFTNAIFGNTAVRAEINTVTDFYRGMLLRLPDDGGLAFWRDRFRAAQCAANPGNAVNAEVESISSLFALSQEYANRARNNSQYVGDLFNAFLRRGGDLGGVKFWIDELTSGRRSRENVRQAFVASPEFQARVVAIINQGCLK